MDVVVRVRIKLGVSRAFFSAMHSSGLTTQDLLRSCVVNLRLLNLNKLLKVSNLGDLMFSYIVPEKIDLL